jgi:hypothetical protein
MPCGIPLVRLPGLLPVVQSSIVEDLLFRSFGIHEKHRS